MRWLILSWATLSVVLSGVAGGAHRGAGAQEPVGTRSDRRVQPTPALLTTHMTAASPRPEGASAACSMPSTVPYFVAGGNGAAAGAAVAQGAPQPESVLDQASRVVPKASTAARTFRASRYVSLMPS